MVQWCEPTDTRRQAHTSACLRSRNLPISGSAVRFLRFGLYAVLARPGAQALAEGRSLAARAAGGGRAAQGQCAPGDMRTLCGMSGAIHLGTSGYMYKHWKGIFYPKGLPPSRWLPYYARVFRTVELNATFYRLPTPETVESWREQVPAGFRFAAKGSRYLTHMKRLNEVGEGLERFLHVIRLLGPKLGPVLWQLPAQMSRPNPEKLENFLAHLPRDLQHAFEFRHVAWYRDDILALLDRYGVALVEHDATVWPPRPTAGWRYLRFHGWTSRYAGRYGKEALEPHARSLLEWKARGRTAWVYFNNDLHGHALLDALDLSELLGTPLHRPETQPLEALHAQA